MHYLVAGFIGLISGTLSGLFGVGGGIILVPAMMFFLNPPIRDIKQAIGTSLAVIIPTAMMGSYDHLTHHNVNWRIAALLVPLAIVGAKLGVWLTTQVPANNLKQAFGGFLMLVGLRILLFK